MPLPTPDDLTTLRRDRDRSMAALISANRRAGELEEALRDAGRAASDPADETLVRIRRELDAVRARAAEEQKTHLGLSDRASAGLNEWLRQTPEQLVERLPARDPFLLFPVRLETRFHRTPAGAAELLVRIWPDDIGIAIPPGDLSPAERAAGDQYWRARGTVATTPATDPMADAARQAYEAAWAGIATAYGAYRAGWIVHETKPTNWDDVTNAPHELPLVPPNPVPSTEPRIARAGVLPDRFVITGGFKGQTLADVVGLAIPDDLALAPDPAHAEAMIDRDNAGRLVVAEALKWMFDFDTAVSVGMGIRVPLPPPWDATGFDFLMAIGVRGATTPAHGITRVEDLLATHRFDTGCGIVTNGTPTNNTDAVVSGWRPPSTESEQLFTIEDKPPVISPQPKAIGDTDGWRLVRLLGLSEGFVRRLPNAPATDVAEALAMNRAVSFATVFEFVKVCLEPLVDAPTRAALRDFFHRHVSGRGSLPAVRVGRQPYGIVVTSDWTGWTVDAPVTGHDTIEKQLFELMKVHRLAWKRFAEDSVQAGTRDANPFKHFMLIVGQLASSAQYASRTALTEAQFDEALKIAVASKVAQEVWHEELQKQRGPNLDVILSAAAQLKKPTLAQLLFTERTEPWIAPIVDRDPKVPLSESAVIAPFDGVRNYLQWLSQVSLNDLESERFVDAKGATIAPPTALLYVLLRYALLTAVEEGSLEVETQAGNRFFDVITREPAIANIGQSQHVLFKDYLTVNAAPLGLSPVSKPVANWVHESARAALVTPFFAALKVVTDANDSIAALATVPTARLERLLAEHIDLCSYRLDAWITALYAQRLEEMRGMQQEPGLYLGAYGWVENLFPKWAARTPIPADALPLSLRSVARGPVFQSTDNGGFVHAPSLPQACTAAVLRNAYLSHATEEEPDLFSVNLSSARVRVAQTYIEGIRNGQSMAALLGYEFERGLHERHPSEELDVFRYKLRDRFPFLAGKLTELQVGVNAEVVEARNVVNGLDLLEHTADQGYPYGLAALLPPAGTTAALAIVNEIDRLRDGLDAVSDLLLAESVHQAVQGNLERTKASLQALTDPEAAPDPEVVRTPRSARLLTFRMALRLDAADLAKWPGPLTARAAANRAVNAWLTHHLPAPSAIQWSVKNGVAPAQFNSAADLHLQPIDLVLLTGDQLGQLSSELERFIVRLTRASAKVADDVRTRVAPLSGPADDVPPLVLDFAASAPGARSLAMLHPLLVRLRRLISRGRAMHALDWLPSTEINRVPATDPTGSASGLADLNTRLDAGVSRLTTLRGALELARAALAPLQPPIDAVMNELFTAHTFGIPEALPAESEELSEARVKTLDAQARVVLTLIDKRLAAAATLRTPDPNPPPTTEPEKTVETARRLKVSLERATDAARELFGSAFVIVPLFQLHQPAQATEVQLAAGGSAIATPIEVEEWLHSVARVRPVMGDVAWTMAVSAWTATRIADPLVVQLPRRPDAPWIGGSFTTPLPDGEWLAVVTLNGAVSFSGVQCGLVLDEWTESVPADHATTGVAFHFDRPNATAPQALLLAVPPVARGAWQWNALKGSVREAYELAKLRAVQPEALMTGGYFQGLPAILSEFTQSRFAATHLAERSARVATHIFP